jgi:hypothetical protein
MEDQSKSDHFWGNFLFDRDPSLRSGCTNYGFFPSTHSGLNSELASHSTGLSME